MGKVELTENPFFTTIQISGALLVSKFEGNEKYLSYLFSYLLDLTFDSVKGFDFGIYETEIYICFLTFKKRCKADHLRF